MTIPLTEATHSKQAPDLVEWMESRVTAFKDIKINLTDSTRYSEVLIWMDISATQQIPPGTQKS